jgi:anthranilate phosphoribosyltransferase
MKQTLEKLMAHQTLTQQEAKSCLVGIGCGQYNEAQVTAFMTVFLMRSITVAELTGFREAMLEMCLKVDLAEFDPIDVCGTGGDGKDTFNISTLVSFVVAGAGQPVAKHGNYGVSSTCGSSTLMEYMGYTFSQDEASLKADLKRANICFIHAPLFHPAMKQVGSIRKALGLKTFFNQLGPMVNPALPKKQLVGVYSLELLRLYTYLYQTANIDYVLVHDLAGYDEVSLTGTVKVITNNSDTIVDAEWFGLGRWHAEQIRAGQTVAESANIFISVLKNQATPAQTAVVLSNASLALRCAKAISLPEALHQAQQSLESGRALACFNLLVNS